MSLLFTTVVFGRQYQSCPDQRVRFQPRISRCSADFLICASSSAWPKTRRLGNLRYIFSAAPRPALLIAPQISSPYCCCWRFTLDCPCN